MRRFHHVGVIVDQVQPGEIFVAETRVHVTNPAGHPYRVETLRFEPDSSVTGPVRDQPHMAFVVDDLEAEIEGQRVLLGPFRAMEGLRVAFVLRDGAVFEFMQFDAPSVFDGGGKRAPPGTRAGPRNRGPAGPTLPGVIPGG